MQGLDKGIGAGPISEHKVSDVGGAWGIGYIRRGRVGGWGWIRDMEGEAGEGEKCSYPCPDFYSHYN